MEAKSVIFSLNLSVCATPLFELLMITKSRWSFESAVAAALCRRWPIPAVLVLGASGNFATSGSVTALGDQTGIKLSEASSSSRSSYQMDAALIIAPFDADPPGCRFKLLRAAFGQVLAVEGCPRVTCLVPVSFRAPNRFGPPGEKTAAVSSFPQARWCPFSPNAGANQSRPNPAGCTFPVHSPVRRRLGRRAPRP